MAQAQLAALPPILPPSPGRPANASPEANPGMDGETQAFARVLDRKVHGEPREARDTPPANPRSEPAKTPDGLSGQAPASNGKPTEGPDETPSTAPSAGPGNAPAGPDPLLSQTSNPETTDTELAAPAPAESEESAPDPLQASLAGMPAALAALLTGAPVPATPPVATGIIPGQPGGDPARGPAASKGDTPGLAAALKKDGLPLADTPAGAGAIPIADDGTPATEAPGRTGKADVLPATETPFGPASRASEVAQLAANPEAGQGSGGRVEFDPASGLPVQAAPVAHSQRVDSTLRIHLPRPTDHPAWAESVANRVTWMVGQQESVAELVLTPPQLGRVEVTVSINGDQTTAQFVAATPAAREALEQALPRLREVLAEAGINLAESGVSTSDRHNPGDSPSRQGPGRLAAGGHLMNDAAPMERAWLQQGKGLVDTFA